MGLLTTNNKQSIYIYSEDSKLGVSVLSHIKKLKRRIRIINLNRESLSTPIWLEIISMLDVSFSELFKREQYSLFTPELQNNMTTGDWLKLIEHNPSLLIKPIAINGINAKIIEAKYDVFDFFVGHDTKAINVPNTIQVNTNYNSGF